MRFAFGGLTLDTDTRQLLRGSTDIHVSPKALDLLSLLISERPRALSKAELLEKLWPGTYVTENNLASLVAEIRQAIGDDARTPRFVRTVQRFGYAFKGEVGGAAEASPGGHGNCWLEHGSRRIPLGTGEHILGRDTDWIALESDTVSRRHARIIVGADASLEDLGSKNATFLRGERVTGPTRLAHGDEIRIGPFVLHYRESRPVKSTETETG